MLESIPPYDYLLVRLAAVHDGRRTATQFASDLRPRLPKAVSHATLDALAADGLVVTAPRVALTAAGHSTVTARFGTPGTGGMRRLERRTEPALALGIRLDSPVADRLTRPEAFRGIVLNRLCQLALDDAKVTQAGAMAAIVERALCGRELPAPAGDIIRFGVSRAGDLRDLDALRTTLIRTSLALGCAEGDQATPADREAAAEAPASGADVSAGDAAAEQTPAGSTTGFADRLDGMLSTYAFARRVNAVADVANTPIAAVYESYGERFDDAGTIDAFKTRLLGAARAGHVALLPVDEFTALDDNTRRRSEIVTPTSRLHLVARSPA
jgi:hypothetical protein